MCRLAPYPVTEMSRGRLIHTLDAFDLARSERRDAGNHLVGDTHCPQRSVVTHSRLMLRPEPSGSLHIGLCSCVDADHIAWLDEKRYLDRGPGLELRGLGGPRHRVSLESWIGGDDFQLHVDRQLDPDQAVLVPQQIGDAAFLQ